MGNCINHEAMVSWTEDEGWEWADSGRSEIRRRPWAAAVRDKRERMMEEGKTPSVDAPAASAEVKVRITKKQLEELMRIVDGGALPVQQALSHLISGSLDHTPHWRPALQSIPETAES